MTVIGPAAGFHAPTSPIFSYTDHTGVVVDAAKARFARPLGSYGTLDDVTPNARVRFRSDAPHVVINLEFNNLHFNSYYYDIFSVYVDGVWHSDHNPPDVRAVFRYDIDLSFAGSDFRTIEVIWPYCAGVDFLGVTQDPAYRVTACRPRPTGKLLAIGDSITHTFYGTASRNGFPFLLAEELGLQCLNMGFAGAKSDSHGTAPYVAGLEGIEIVTILLGVNDVAEAVPLATYQANMEALLEGVLSGVSSEAEVYVITPIWVAFPEETFNTDDYRSRVSDAVTAVDDSRLTVVDGLTLCDNDTGHVPDGVHPGDAGFAAMADNLAAIIG